MIRGLPGAPFAFPAHLGLLGGREDVSCHFLPCPSRFVRNPSLWATPCLQGGPQNPGLRAWGVISVSGLSVIAFGFLSLHLGVWLETH